MGTDQHPLSKSVSEFLTTAIFVVGLAWPNKLLRLFTEYGTIGSINIEMYI